MGSIFHTTGVYKITNTLNGDFYIGSSINIERRWRDHKYQVRLETPGRDCSHVHHAMRKYGIDAFLFEIIEECEPIKSELLEREQHYLDTLSPVYNISRTASSRLGSRTTKEESLRRIREGVKNRIDPRKGKSFAEGYGDRADEMYKRIFLSGALEEVWKNRVGKAHKNNTSGVGGICFDKSRNKWMLRIKTKQIGRFDTLEEAVIWRDKIFANELQHATSFPQPEPQTYVKHHHDGESLTIREWAEKTGLKIATIRMRMRRGKNISEALSILNT